MPKDLKSINWLQLASHHENLHDFQRTLLNQLSANQAQFEPTLQLIANTQLIELLNRCNLTQFATLLAYKYHLQELQAIQAPTTPHYTDQFNFEIHAGVDDIKDHWVNGHPDPKYFATILKYDTQPIQFNQLFEFLKDHKIEILNLNHYTLHQINQIMTKFHQTNDVQSFTVYQILLDYRRLIHYQRWLTRHAVFDFLNQTVSPIDRTFQRFIYYHYHIKMPDYPG